MNYKGCLKFVSVFFQVVNLLLAHGADVNCKKVRRFFNHLVFIHIYDDILD